MTHQFNILIKRKDNTVSYLTHRGRDAWSIKTARKYLKECVGELQQNNPKWTNVRYFACVMA